MYRNWTALARFPTGGRTAVTRLPLLGAVLGALVALTTNIALTSAAAPETPLAEQPGAQEPEATLEQDGAQPRAAFTADPGACLTWEDDEARDLHEVDCDEEHLFEVVDVVDISGGSDSGDSDSGDSGDGGPPEVDEWQGLAEEHCTDPADDYLDDGLDPHGRFQVSAVFPTAAEWEAGQRELHCGLWWPAPGGELQEMPESAASADQSAVWEEGTCLDVRDGAVGNPVDCAEPHALEMVAEVDLADEFGSDPPAEDEQMSWLDERCAELSEDYTGDADLSGENLVLSWDTLEEESWDAGSTRVNCKVGAMLADESGLAPVTGSVAEDAEDEVTVEEDPDGDSGDGDSEDGDSGDAESDE